MGDCVANGGTVQSVQESDHLDLQGSLLMAEVQVVSND